MKTNTLTPELKGVYLLSAEISNQGAPFYDRTAIIGTGLIGGSMGIRLRERRLVEMVVGYDQSEAALEQALARGAVDCCAKSAREAVAGAELVIMAVPVLSIAALVEEIEPALAPGSVITDVGSTKLEVTRAVEKILPRNTCFIGGHPMAGSEESGIAGAEPALLENAIYVLTPGKSAPPQEVKRLTRLLEAAGAQPLVLDPAGHDALAAYVSHLPHLAASALVDSVMRFGKVDLVLALAAGGFRDTTRVALGNPALWRDICLSNRRVLARALTDFSQSINELAGHLAAGDGAALEEYLNRAREFRRRVPRRGRGILPDLHEVMVLVPDVPGVIGRLAGLLGDAGINIASIEILHVREMEGGSVRLGFRDHPGQEQALAVLKAAGYRAFKKE